jgi:hypothetical protein
VLKVFSYSDGDDSPLLLLFLLQV